MSRHVYTDGVLRERWDNATRLYTAWDQAGVQTVQRPFTAEENARADAEIAAQQQETNGTSLRQRAESALAANTTDIATNDTFVAIASPTNAQNAAQVKELTRQSTRQARELNALIRLVIGRLDSLDGT